MHIRWVKGSTIKVDQNELGRPWMSMTIGPLLSPTAAARDLNGREASDSGVKRGLFRGGDSDRETDFGWLVTSSEDRNFVNAEEDGRVRSVNTSTAISSYPWNPETR